MEDFTGGITEMYDLAEAPPNLFNLLLKGYERNSMMACSIEPDPNEFEAETREGLIKGHAYTITKIDLMDISTPNRTGKIPMVSKLNLVYIHMSYGSNSIPILSFEWISILDSQ